MNSRRLRTLGLLAGLTAACVAGSATIDDPDPDPQDVCPPPPGEFPPTDCALVRGIAKVMGGQVLPGIPIRVDSVVGANYYYASNTATSGSDGRFSLTVFRTNRLKPPTNPDTATVELKTYAKPNPQARDSAIGRAPVLMYFAELGRPVKPSIVEAIFDLLSGR